ncbi:hypothetical protein BU15DRAFT_55780, partial [Melanogaster broomeanus]
VHQGNTGESFLEKTCLFNPDAPMDLPLTTSLMWPSDITFIALSFFQIALFDLLVSLSLKPDAVVGQLVGETVVLYASGLAAYVPFPPSPLFSPGWTSTLRSRISRHLTAPMILAYPEHIDTFVSFIQQWVSNVAAHKLRINTAAHSQFVDPCETQFCQDLKAIFAEYPGPHVPTTTTMSTVTAEFKVESYTPEYLWNNLRQPVLFSSAIPKITERFGEWTVFVEVSPSSCSVASK